MTQDEPIDRVAAGIARRRHPPVVALAGAALRTRPPVALGLGLVLLVASILPAGLALASGVLVGRLSAGGEGVVAASVPAVCAIGVLFLLQQLLPPIAAAVADDLGRAVQRKVTGRMLAIVQRPPSAEHLDDPRISATVQQINDGLGGTGIRDALAGALNIGIVRCGAIVGGLILLAYRWWIALLLLAAYAYAASIISRSFQQMIHSSEGAPARMRRAMYLREQLYAPSSAREVRLFGLAGWLVDGYRSEWRKAIGDLRGERRGSLGVSLRSGAVVLVAQAIAFGAMAYDWYHGDLSAGRFTTFALAATALFGLNAVTPDLVSIAIAGDVLDTVDDLDRRVPGDGRGEPVTAALPRLAESITFEHVGYRYPGAERAVLEDVNLTIPAGSSTAVVGVNGAGKTTLVKLLVGLYRPTRGRILVDGVDLASTDLAEWQRRCGALFQDWLRWGLTVRENVQMGGPGRPLSDADLTRIADACGLSEVVAGLPDGWSTVLSREFGGVDLSGGQWQRVGLARALWALETQSDLLVLDEPTAALDVRGETELYSMLLPVAAGKTLVLISHRFSTVRYADQILVLEDGVVCESGTHQSLMEAEGHYARMFRVQSDRFNDAPAAR